MFNKPNKFISYIIISIVIYFVIVCIQWTYETKYTFNLLLNNIITYDTQVLAEAKKDQKNILQYFDIFIETKHINSGIWFSKWNIFNWSESKYIYKNNRKKILNNLNYWRQTKQLPTMYNLNIKSVYKMEEKKTHNIAMD
jgi:hypothetical protein